MPGLLAYSAAAALAEVRQLAAPATLGVTTLSGVEDHASLAPLALQLLERSAALVDELAAIEALHAVDLLRVTDARPTGAGTGPLFAAGRRGRCRRDPGRRTRAAGRRDDQVTDRLSSAIGSGQLFLERQVADRLVVRIQIEERPVAE